MVPKKRGLPPVNLLVQYALSFVGTPYKWGGSNSLEGLDCSGLVQSILASAGIDPPGDQTAQSLFDHFDKLGATPNRHGPGSLAFYGQSVTKITHVAFMLDTYRVLEAGGGGHLTLTFEDAARQSALIRIRKINHRNDLVAVLRPSYSKIGVI